YIAKPAAAVQPQRGGFLPLTSQRGPLAPLTINPHAWLAETLSRLAAGHPANAVGELMPWTAVA
ncbi:transposase domain-containing protein, partial [Novosphingobium sp. TCA1]|uniref:transposase domain-containing protein n=1 Tax=Novosphingobium sp. TCA1 TaxID=2682474 RepID=UPI001F292069